MNFHFVQQPAQQRARPGQAATGLLSPTGGLVWHYRALRFKSNWNPFIEGLSDWLQSWEPGNDRLLILGASAGWCLRSRFLVRFRDIVAVDLDPLAPLIFGFRHGAALRNARTSIRWLRSDAIGEFDRLLELYPSHSVLFCNLLGQLIVHFRDIAATEQYLRQLPHKLAGRNWATFHDRLSKSREPGDSPPRNFCKAGNLTSLSVARLACVHGVWGDHLTGDVLPDSVCKHYFAWPITPARMHIIEAGFVPGSKDGLDRNGKQKP